MFPSDWANMRLVFMEKRLENCILTINPVYLHRLVTLFYSVSSSYSITFHGVIDVQTSPMRHGHDTMPSRLQLTPHRLGGKKMPTERGQRGNLII